jgi:hypothetical protein
MKRIKALWLPLLLGVLLMATVVGVAGAKPDARPQQQGWRVLTVSPADCVSRDDLHAWWHSTTYLECWESGATCAHLCAVNFPAAGEQAVGAVNVKRLTMFAYDNNGGSDIDANLYKLYPPTGGSVMMASVATTGTSAADPQGGVMDTSIVGNPVYRTQGPYIWVHLSCCNIELKGFFIHYTW